MSSSYSSGMNGSFNRRGAERGLPKKCRCGAESVIKTADTLKNPGRLFHCCPYGSKEDNGHLFKWTDIAMVEEMKEVEGVVEKIQAEMESLACETRTCEAVASSYEKEIEAIKALAKGCEKEIGELKAMIVCSEKEIQSLRCFKNIIVCSVVLFVVYVFIF
ncbi:uncharacterized protein At1g43920, Chloroplastic-like [Arabidopsis lyrata subsp. lyrata]|uniref:uncharacterized protein At1g43920, Chloroplastic-like n=1 Tax=Arabidopsis lyrata subsp. lyrata TaxID=81972 RepID=UPI000A29E5D7|nr:uncharacterized protein At1g43920, Chloroplastic-like [Arabidopsis lyrata subsp. lyrata]|eukprot:XP_020869481.1 uncharacterized protein At1g43920, Chloroplastic-like [Arabidopsis lyrata subsp. lyrata]